MYPRRDNSAATKYSPATPVRIRESLSITNFQFVLNIPTGIAGRAQPQRRSGSAYHTAIENRTQQKSAPAIFSVRLLCFAVTIWATLIVDGSTIVLAVTANAINTARQAARAVNAAPALLPARKVKKQQKAPLRGFSIEYTCAIFRWL